MPREIVFTPERVIQLAFRGEVTELFPDPKDWNPDYKESRVVKEQETFTAEQIRRVLEEVFEEVDFEGLQLFYCQDRNLYWYVPGRTKSSQIDELIEESIIAAPFLDRVRRVVYDWFQSKGANVIASEQTVYPLISNNGLVGYNSTRWGQVLGETNRVCKASMTAYVDCPNLDLDHPNLVNERSLALSKERWVFSNKLHFSVKGCHLTYAPNLRGVKNLDEMRHELDQTDLVRLLIDGLEGLDHLHQQDLVYCDFKLEQVLAVNTDQGYEGQLSDFETLRPQDYEGEFLSNPTIREDSYYNQMGFMQGQPLPVDKARDSFSVGVEILKLMLEGLNPVFGLQKRIDDYAGEDLEKDLPNILGTCLLEEEIDEVLGNSREYLQSYVWGFKNQRDLNRKFRLAITDAYKKANGDAEEVIKLRSELSSELSEYMPTRLADLIVRAMGNIREDRPSVREMIEALKEIA